MRAVGTKSLSAACFDHRRWNMLLVETPFCRDASGTTEGRILLTSDRSSAWQFPRPHGGVVVHRGLGRELGTPSGGGGPVW